MDCTDRIRDGYYDGSGWWQRTKYCFISCGEACTCSPPLGQYYSPAHDKRSADERARDPMLASFRRIARPVPGGHMTIAEARAMASGAITLAREIEPLRTPAKRRGNKILDRVDVVAYAWRLCNPSAPMPAQLRWNADRSLAPQPEVLT